MKLHRAVVEDNNDPEKIGRVKVRIYGMHTEKNENSGEFSSISTSDLPWAEVMGGNQFGLISGVGTSSVLRKGTWVWIVLEDENPNKPVVIGTLIGKNDGKTDYASGDGFCDPDKVYPKDDRANRSDMNPLLDSKYQTLATLETESGHIIELDDTPNDERIKVTHKTGSYIFIDKDGNMFINGVANIQYDIAGNATWNIGGNQTTNVQGETAHTTNGDTTVSAANIYLN
jgi:uncharacterized protein involved in type VI secretion and phage assembly